MAKRKIKEFERIDIIDIAARGKCVGRTAEGEIVLVEQVVPGDVIKGNAIRKRKGMWNVRRTEFIQKSPDRVQARCQHFEDCGGCKWQDLSIEKQLFYKEKQVHETIRRLGGVSEFEAKPIVASPRSFDFRNKMEFSFSNKLWISDQDKNSQVDIPASGGLGLHPPGWFEKVVDIETCHLIPDAVNEIRKFVRDIARELNLTFYDSKLHIGDMRNLRLRNNRKGEVMAVFIFGSELSDAHQDLMKQTQMKFSSITSLYSIVNTKANDSTFDLDAILQSGEHYLSESIGEVEFKIGPQSFFQTNIYQTEQLYAEVKRLAQLTGDEVVFDLYSGIGSIALYLADQASEIVAVEDVAAAVEDAKLNAKLNGVGHIKYHIGKMEELIGANDLNDLPKPDVIITDPPRAGMHAAVVQFILNQAPARIVYVSCDPATQARDISKMKEAYEVVSVQPFDMFPHTSHVESVALLERRE
jgi:23S rRNA (uracil1939-C5)-methyltransferase